MQNGWMVRAGEGGRLFDEFEKGFIAVGWTAMGNISGLNTRQQMTDAYIAAYPDSKAGKRPNDIAMIDKFKNDIQIGDIVLTYDPQSRNYLIGEVVSEYIYSQNAVGDYRQTRKAKWLGKVSRDQLKQKTRNSLGSTLTLFKLNEFVLADLMASLKGEKLLSEPDEEIDEAEVGSTKEDTVNRSKELIKDKIIALDAEEMEHLVAALIRAMGFRARVTPKGPDRGVDVVASPDGLGLLEPRIKAEVKHRGGTIGAPSIRGFIGALRQGDKGIYVSTGGFTREARYEAERSNIPVTLVDIDVLAELIVDNYENFDLEGKALVPLVRIYWPADI